MATECTTRQLQFEGLGRRQIVADFSGGEITSDAGGLLLREVDRKTRILDRFAACFDDRRDPIFVEHSIRDLVAQRVFGLALGYEDVSDHDDLRHDPLLAVLVGKTDPEGTDRLQARDRGKPLAGKSTLNRLELGTPEEAADHRYKKIVLDAAAVDRLFVDAFLESHAEPPTLIEIDVDATDDPLYGNQEGRFFQGYYKCYCYLPLYIFCGDAILGARLRRSDIDGAEGAVEELDRIVRQIRETWPEVEILIRGDSGFCREKLMAWCEANGLLYVLGLAKNSRLKTMITPELEQARARCEEREEPVRIFKEFDYQTRDTWTRARRVIAKAEHLPGRSNPRFIVTNLPAQGMSPQDLYEGLYCVRGEMENRIKEQQLHMFADRTSAATMRANQMRLYFSSIAYMLMSALRRLGLAGGELARAQCHTIRTKLLKIGARVRVTTRKIWVSLSSSCPFRDLFIQAYERLRLCPG